MSTFMFLEHYLLVKVDLNDGILIRQQKYLNNIQEQDHYFTKRRVRQSQWFQSFQTARNTIAGYETMHMIRKGRVKNMAANNGQTQVKFGP